MNLYYKIRVLDKDNHIVWEHGFNNKNACTSDIGSLNFFKNKGMTVETTFMEEVKRCPLNDEFVLNM